MIVEVQKEAAGNRYEMVMSHEICDLCEEISNKESNYQQYLQFFGFPDNCPFEPVSYLLYILSIFIFPALMVKYGFYNELSQVLMSFVLTWQSSDFPVYNYFIYKDKGRLPQHKNNLSFL